MQGQEIQVFPRQHVRVYIDYRHKLFAPDFLPKM
jgi:hypothetical protein